jgi:hypothetical protein
MTPSVWAVIGTDPKTAKPPGRPSTATMAAKTAIRAMSVASIRARRGVRVERAEFVAPSVIVSPRPEHRSPERCSL